MEYTVRRLLCMRYGIVLCGFRIWRSPLCIYIKEDMCSKYNHLKEENKMSRVYNFSAGPAVLPEDVLKEAAAEMLDYRGTGMSVMEMSHRSKAYDTIIKEAESRPAGIFYIFRIIIRCSFLQGGAIPSTFDHGAHET